MQNYLMYCFQQYKDEADVTTERANQKGFTLVELMMVVATVGILTAISLPAYQDYTFRSKMSNLVLATGAAKNRISEYIIHNSTLAIPASMNIKSVNEGMISSLYWSGTSINVIGNSTNLGSSNAIKLSMKPSGSPTEGVLWVCSISEGTRIRTC